MLVRFTKMHGLGNDFMLLDQISQNLTLRQEQIAALADRRLGVGFDQMLVAQPPSEPHVDFDYRIYNADGTEAEQCGNGARCFLRFVRDRGLTTKTKILLRTTTGEISCALEKDGSITVDMGEPVLQPADIPFQSPVPQILYPLDVSSPICGAHQTVQISAVNMGNPHAVTVVDNVETAPVSQLGPLIEKHVSFPQKANAGFMQC